MNRSEFYRKLMRYALFAALIMIVFVLAKRIVYGRNCSGCPDEGICSGKVDCGKF